MDDLQLRRHILDELDYEPSVDAANIGVAVENGVVTLTGHVPRYAEKLGARRSPGKRGAGDCGRN
jgi:osmotically-inducible protein OsmY